MKLSGFVLWTCDGCKKRYRETYEREEGETVPVEVFLECPVCTPGWKKLVNKMKRIGRKPA